MVTDWPGRPAAGTRGLARRIPSPHYGDGQSLEPPLPGRPQPGASAPSLITAGQRTSATWTPRAASAASCRRKDAVVTIKTLIELTAYAAAHGIDLTPKAKPVC